MASIEEVLAEEDPTNFAIALSDLVFPGGIAMGSTPSPRPSEWRTA